MRHTIFGFSHNQNKKADDYARPLFVLISVILFPDLTHEKC
jgi:hypothetical protein